MRPGRRLSLRQVLDLQDIAFQAAQGLIADFKETNEKEERARVASAISNLAKGWVSLQDAKREILGKPKAGVRKHPAEKESKRKAQWGQILDLEDVPPGKLMKAPPDTLEPTPTEALPHGKANEVGYKMQDMPEFPGAKVMVKVESSPMKDAAVAGVEVPSKAPSAPASKPEVEAPGDVLCATCGGKGSHRNSNFGVDIECRTCKGTGRIPTRST